MKIINYDPSDAAQAEIDWACRYDDICEDLIDEADREEDGELYAAVLSKFGKPEPSLLDAMNENSGIYDFVQEKAFEIAKEREKEW